MASVLWPLLQLANPSHVQVLVVKPMRCKLSIPIPGLYGQLVV